MKAYGDELLIREHVQVFGRHIRNNFHISLSPIRIPFHFCVIAFLLFRLPLSHESCNHNIVMACDRH
jgi:hypothetical protein